ALPLEEFTAERDAEVRRLRGEGDKHAATEVRALKKPSKAAWAINQVVRQRVDAVQRLFAAGGRVRDALSAGQDVRAASRELAAVADELAEAVVALAGEPARDGAVTTFRAAAADADRGEELAAARLVAPMASTGFDVAGLAVAPPDRSGAATEAEEREARRRAEAEDRLDRLRAEAERTRERAELLAAEAAEAERRAEDLREQ